MSRQNPTPADNYRFWRFWRHAVLRRRLSWGNAPDELRWSELSWRDRARVLGVVATIVLIALAGSLR